MTSDLLYSMKTCWITRDHHCHINAVDNNDPLVVIVVDDDVEVMGKQDNLTPMVLTTTIPWSLEVMTWKSTKCIAISLSL